jgi:molecular chaperone HscC
MIVGIDLGTTNSAIAVWKDGGPQLIPNSLGHSLTPSAVSIGKDGEITVGLAARERQAIDPDNTATAFKRYMGTGHRLMLRGDYYTPEDLSALVLRSLKADAEAFLGEEIGSAVITVPAYFNDKQRRATKRAGELAGLEVARLVNEPTAAALAYGIHERDQEEPFLIFDLGGGTFDVSLVEIFDGIIEVRASAGDNRLGGEDFNMAVVELLKDKIGDAISPTDKNPHLFEILRATAEKTRRQLTQERMVAAKFVWNDTEYEAEITREDFEAKSKGLLDRLREPILRSLRDSNTKIAELSEIVLVGGSTRMPIVRDAVTRMFGRFPNVSIDPDYAIALGAAVQAGLKSRNADLDEIRLTDVCPFTLGTDMNKRDSKGNHIGVTFAPIIERNTVIPASRMRQYSNAYDDQTTVTLGIYQGESRDLEKNIKLGELDIDIPKRPKGKVLIDCRFTYDTSGLLEVDVTIPETGLTKQLAIYDKDDPHLAKDIEKRRAELAKLKVHPRDDAINAAMVARAERCYEGFLGDTRDYIEQLMIAFETALNSQDPKIIKQARDEIGKKLDVLEGETFL